MLGYTIVSIFLYFFSAVKVSLPAGSTEIQGSGASALRARSALCRHRAALHGPAAPALPGTRLGTARFRDTAGDSPLQTQAGDSPALGHGWGQPGPGTLLLKGAETGAVTHQPSVGTLCSEPSAAEGKAMESSHCKGILVIQKLFNTIF